MPDASQFTRRIPQAGEIPPPPIAALIGFTVASMGTGRAVVELEADERHANPQGSLHGGEEP